MFKKKAIISACLLGEVCRYDGKTKEVNAVIEAFVEYQIIPFCPEAPLFGTPRERISVLIIGDVKHIITDESSKDVTALLREEIEAFCEVYSNADAIVLKSKSPSCGFGTTPLLDAKREVIGFGNGIAADIFLERYPQIKIEDETVF
ncbi:MAG TPA: hypothetical protein CFH84_01905 [Sulfurimonas sp. UBA12504]|nr:MAG: hypothetical protein A2019_01630 [Sulfurimonas sp. GWF2_37_8]DAB30852.1 MAG TPA: hypothetical protein CFH84_01905 [Sulfurimonas sp. UBA12504]